MQVVAVQQAVHRIPLAFPCLTRLDLFKAQLQDGALFDMLACQASCMLRSLQLWECSIHTDAVVNAAQSLALLPHLNALKVMGSGAGIAAQLTGLTSLVINSQNNATAGQMCRIAGQNTGLVQLELGRYTYYDGPPLQASRHQLSSLSKCTSLTQLNIAGFQIDGQALDVLLTQLTSITDLTLGATTLDSSRADRQCSWRKLTLRGPQEGILAQLAYLPLRSVQEGGINVLSGTLVLPAPDAVAAAQLPRLVHQAAINLTTCPAWINAAPARLSLQGAGQALTAEQRVQLFQALAPMGGPHVTEMTINLAGQLQLDSAEVQALASTTSGSLKALSLGNCTLLCTFWKVLPHHLPQLSSIALSHNVVASAMDIAMYLAIRSSSSMQPLHLAVGSGVLDEESQLWLEQHISGWQLQLHNITLLLE
jgi:hypothetical protein